MNLLRILKYYILPVVLGLLSTMQTVAQDSAVSEAFVWEWTAVNILVTITTTLMILVLLYFWYITEILLKSYRRDIVDYKGLTFDEDDDNKGALGKVLSNLWGGVSMEKEKSIILDHDFDGIRELDNKLPPWWVYLFYITIIWGIALLYIYHGSDIGLSQNDEYAIEMEAAEYDRMMYVENQANKVNENNVVVLESQADLSKGQEIYIANCSACHGQAGEGGVGPNLTDKFWITGGDIKSIFKSIKYGVPEKGMISWQNQLQPITIQMISSYILTLQGTDPPNGKAAQGDLFDPEG